MTEKYYHDYPNEPIGGDNPYYRCSYCKRSDPEINGYLERHEEWCEYRIKKTGGTEMTTYRAEKIWEAFKGELIDNGLKDSEDVKQALSTAIREVAERLYTDLPELGHPSVVLEEIADELDEMEAL